MSSETFAGLQNLLLQTPEDQWIQYGLILLVIVIAWVVLRFVLRLAMRVFALGCGLILFLGLAFFLFQYLN